MGGHLEIPNAGKGMAKLQENRLLMPVWAPFCRWEAKKGRVDLTGAFNLPWINPSLPWSSSSPTSWEVRVGHGGLVLGLPASQPTDLQGQQGGPDVSEPAEAPEVWHPSRDLSSDTLWPFLSCTCPQAAQMPTKLHAESTPFHPDSLRTFSSLFLKFQDLETGTFQP